ncbi:MAG TPA: SpoIIE family protein phosphatase, partial [Vicinamibacteria bacterium]|nr:SpoIIE family protein phosphatase [Vicinamibacteria bacterium]
LIVMGELQVGRGGIFVRGEDGLFRVKASRGLPAGAPAAVALGALPREEVLRRGSDPEGAPAFAAFGLELLCPVFKGDRAIAVLGLGPRAEGRPFGPEEVGFLRSLAACTAAPIENGLIYDELRRVNQKLSVKVFQLHNLFDISRELTGSFDEETIKNLITTTAMGHFMVSRCALYLGGAAGLALAHERGLHLQEDAVVPEEAARPVLEALRAAMPVADLPPGALRDRLLRTRMSLAVPLAVAGRVEGLLALGERASGAPFSEEDRDFAQTLARQALAALETVRLHQVQVEKQRQDRELQIAREIQQSLFPRHWPRVEGFELAAESHACHQVGGDYYDFIPLSGGRLALAIADVAGKGTPASILMASVHASLQALAGTAEPAVLMARLNRFLYESTQDNKYVTLFYAELDPLARHLTYVNGGHVPPYRVTDDRTERLGVGGPVLGLLEHVDYEVGQLRLAPGDLVAMVTDGATEALSPREEEFGDERICGVLHEATSSTAAGALRALVAAVNDWAGPAGCTDDLTALVLKAL